MKIEIFTDGAAKGNPGRGGYGTILRFGKVEKELSDGFRMTTNNRMELLAVIVGLEAIIKKEYAVVIYSDSKYVVDSVSKKWLDGWVRTGFKGKKNKDLWMRYLTAAKGMDVSFVWVKGHAGHAENERCDVLAVNASEKSNLQIDHVFEDFQKSEGLF
jgi:ribonuclease HI